LNEDFADEMICYGSTIEPPIKIKITVSYLTGDKSETFEMPIKRV
jgi:hypothetical protein